MPTTDIDEKIVEVQHAIVRKLAALDKIDCMMNYDMSLIQGRILFEIKNNVEISISDLAKVMEVTPASMSEHIEKLVKKGLVKRIKDAKDRRIVHVALTKNAVGTFEKMHDMKAKRFKEILAVLSHEDKQKLLEIQQKLLAGLNK